MPRTKRQNTRASRHRRAYWLVKLLAANAGTPTPKPSDGEAGERFDKWLDEIMDAAKRGAVIQEK